MFYQITTPRLRSLDAKWRGVINRYKGAAPSGLGVAHMTAESNGNEDPVNRDVRWKPTGIMQVPLRRATKLGYNATTVLTPVNNIYVWGRITNDDANLLKNDYDWWAEANLEFWLTVRLYFILREKAFTSLVRQSSATSLTELQTWITDTMLPSGHVGTYTRRKMVEFSAHIDSMRRALQSLEGPAHITPLFSKRVIVAPGTETQQYKIIEARR